MTTTYQGASRSDGFTAYPERFIVVTDKNHPLYDERNEAIPLDDPDMMGLIANIVEIGVKTQIHVIKDGEDLLVKDGNQRVRAAREANKIRAEKGLDPVQVPFKVVHERNGESQVEKAGMNIRVKSPAMVQARLAAKLEGMGKSREQIATAMGYTPTQVDNFLRLLDCSPKLQKAVEDKKASPAFARGLANLPREEQDKKLDEMIAQGISLKGSEGLQAVSAAKRGEKIEKKSTARRMKNRVWTQELHDRLHTREGSLKKDTRESVLPLLRTLLGYKGAETNLSDDVAEVVNEMAEAKKPRGKKPSRKAA